MFFTAKKKLRCSYWQLAKTRALLPLPSRVINSESVTRKNYFYKHLATYKRKTNSSYKKTFCLILLRTESKVKTLSLKRQVLQKKSRLSFVCLWGRLRSYRFVSKIEYKTLVVVWVAEGRKYVCGGWLCC